MKKFSLLRYAAYLLTSILVGSSGCTALANNPGGGTGAGPNVTVTNNGDGTVTMDNGIVSIVVDTVNARLNTVKYTYNNNGTTTQSDVLADSGGPGRGNYYYGGFEIGSGKYTYSLAVDPTKNGGGYADVKLTSIDSSGRMDAHFSMLRGSPGFYSTATMTHGSGDDAYAGISAWGVVTRVSDPFNWLVADGARNYLKKDRTTSVHVLDSPKESSIDVDAVPITAWDNKFIPAIDHNEQKAWGWASVGSGGLNIGAWIMTNMEFSDGGPLKRDVGVYPGNNLNNSILTGEVGQGNDGQLAAGEVWTKTMGPWFIYYNNVPASITDEEQAADALWADALAQDSAEKGAWPYSWYTDASYTPAAGRGTVTGKIQIHDSNNPNPIVPGAWVGIEQQPQTSEATYDFQKWLKPYQYWTQTDSSGNFTIPDVKAGSNYTLFAFGPGVAGTLQSQELQGGSPPLLYNLPATTFSVTVGAGATTNVGTVDWTDARVAPTVFELGVPDRKTTEFRHGEDYWAPEASPANGFPTPVWGGEAYFNVDFPSGLTYTVGQSRWSTDWNYVLPSLPDTNGTYQPCTGSINFNLATAPASGAQASLYLGLAGAWTYGHDIIVSINGTKLGNATGVTAAPNPLTTTEFGFTPPSGYSDNSSVHLSNHGPFFDERLTFPGTMLHAGTNTLTISNGKTDLQAYVAVDYLRMELTGFKPSPPSSVTSFVGNARILVTWPVVPGAIRYNILRSTTSGSGYVSIASGKIGTVCGADASINTYTDPTALNGTTYYYVVQSWNPSGGYSANSPQSPGITPSSSLSTNVPATPTGLTVTSSGHHKVSVSWNAASAAKIYSISRSTLYPDGVGGYNVLRTITVADAVTGTTYTDTTPTDGKIYSYYVKGVNTIGSSAASNTVTCTPLPAAPSAPPGGFSGARESDATKIDLTWSPVTNATGYVVYRSTTSGSFPFPSAFIQTTVRTKFTDSGLTAGTTYYYRVSAVNSAGVSTGATTTVH